MMYCMRTLLVDCSRPYLPPLCRLLVKLQQQGAGSRVYRQFQVYHTMSRERRRIDNVHLA